MKVLIACMLFLIPFSSWAVNRGINYDPAHSKVYTDAQIANNIQTMKNEMTKDFQNAKNNGFTIVKTFYSMVSTVDGKSTATMADIACPMGLKLVLGVYEFDPNSASDNCDSWCDIARAQQVSAAIASANKYGSACIIGIVVGNEDIYNWNFTAPNTLVQSHISADLTTIKNGLTNSVPLSTAQQDGALLMLAQSPSSTYDPYGIIPQLNFVGANIYPYWSSPSNPDFPSPSQTEFYNRYNAVVAAYTQSVVLTEEGWPSQYNSGQNPNASLSNEQAYYTWWQNRATGAGGTTQDAFDSYYFALYDNQPISGDANNFFGLCTYLRQNKVLTSCS